MRLARSSGLLLHITSLPGRFGIGDLGPEAYRFVDACAAVGQRVWQMLPLGPVAYGYSPYASPSTFAGNPLLISPDLMRRDGLLTDRDLQDGPEFREDSVDYPLAIPYKAALLERAFMRFERQTPPDEFRSFCRASARWLDDYALFAALKEVAHGAVWTEWPPALARREPAAMADATQVYARGMRKHQFWQFLFHRQWRALHGYCRSQGVLVAGDVPIYVAHDSADVWAAQHLFDLKPDGHPRVVAGVPPDFFSATGQRWGNPLYRWSAMQENDYAWWTGRLEHALGLFDVIRLDHFRGFAGYWEIPAHETTAVHGRWVAGPGAALFQHLQTRLGRVPIVAENLGIITEDVTALMEQFGLPGMAVLQFGFGLDHDNEHLPHNYRTHLVAYTGTHDNDTLLGWWASPDLPENERAFASHYLSAYGDAALDICGCAVRALMSSRADWVITPVQDILCLSAKARMNTPGTLRGNWRWRLCPAELASLFEDAGQCLGKLTREHNRAT